MTERLVLVEESVWDRYQMLGEPLRGRLDDPRWARFCALAHATGTDLARRTRGRYPGLPPRAVLEALGAQIQSMPAQEGVSRLFASFTEPNLVRVYEPAARAAQELLRESGGRLPGPASLREILLAHELFHLLEYREPLPTSEKLLVLWKLGPFEYKSRVSALSEIAAASFTRAFLELNYSPNLLDVLLLYPQDRAEALQLYDLILSLEKPDGTGTEQEENA